MYQSRITGDWALDYWHRMKPELGDSITGKRRKDLVAQAKKEIDGIEDAP